MGGAGNLAKTAHARRRKTKSGFARSPSQSNRRLAGKVTRTAIITSIARRDARRKAPRGLVQVLGAGNLAKTVHAQRRKTKSGFVTSPRRLWPRRQSNLKQMPQPKRQQIPQLTRQQIPQLRRQH